MKHFLNSFFRNLDGTRIRAVNDEKKLEEARKRKIEKDAEVNFFFKTSLLKSKFLFIFQDADIRQKKKARKMEEIVQNAAGHHGGKHFYEDEDFVTSKKKSTNSTIESVSIAAQNMKKLAEEKKQREEEMRRKQEEGKKRELFSDIDDIIS